MRKKNLPRYVQTASSQYTRTPAKTALFPNRPRFHPSPVPSATRVDAVDRDVTNRVTASLCLSHAYLASSRSNLKMQILSLRLLFR